MNAEKIVEAKIAEAGTAPGLALRDVCLREIEHAEALLGAAGRRPHDAIHGARKAIRRARAAIALSGIDSGAAEEIDKALQRTARALSRVRDARVAVETGDRMARHAELRSSPGAFYPLRAWLIERRDEALSAYLSRDPAFRRLRTRLRTVHGKVRSLPWNGVGVGAIGRAMSKAVRRAEKVGAKASKRSEENVRHRWRRRLRRLNDQHAVLENLMSGDWPETASDRHKLAARLQRIEPNNAPGWRRLADDAHALGLEHDARLLRRLVRTAPGIDGELQKRLTAAIHRRLRKLHKRTAR